uniref:Uncharacterized protein n=1 Tax=Guillardia theta TaxID=55529 RepID=A0A7S4KT96_GUITH|mmetsp:Transcript_30704/g.98773  ORF Transcript_30704/g.98773 Transcript_30704/m.98773 type:complete len:194 (+) Transcript_30704:348-929(+)
MSEEPNRPRDGEDGQRRDDSDSESASSSNLLRSDSFSREQFQNESAVSMNAVTNSYFFEELSRSLGRQRAAVWYQNSSAQSRSVSSSPKSGDGPGHAGQVNPGLSPSHSPRLFPQPSANSPLIRNLISRKLKKMNKSTEAKQAANLNSIHEKEHGMSDSSPAQIAQSIEKISLDKSEGSDDRMGAKSSSDSNT